MRTPKTCDDRQEASGLTRYLRAIRAYAPLSRDEEHALALRAHKGDGAARQKLVRHNLAFVVSIARLQRRGALPLADIIQEGNLGLMRASEKFDPHAGTRFLTYAAWWIRAYVGRHLQQARSSVRPRGGIVAQHDLSLDTPIAPGDDADVSWLDRLEDEGPGPEDVTLSADSDRQVRAVVCRLRRGIGEVGWDIIHNRLKHPSPQTLREIGDRWGLTRERVRQIEARTKQLLARRLAPSEDELGRDAA